MANVKRENEELKKQLKIIEEFMKKNGMPDIRSIE